MTAASEPIEKIEPRFTFALITGTAEDGPYADGVLEIDGVSIPVYSVRLKSDVRDAPRRGWDIGSLGLKPLNEQVYEVTMRIKVIDGVAYHARVGANAEPVRR